MLPPRPIWRPKPQDKEQSATYVQAIIRQWSNQECRLRWYREVFRILGRAFLGCGKPHRREFSATLIFLPLSFHFNDHLFNLLNFTTNFFFNLRLFFMFTFLLLAFFFLLLRTFLVLAFFLLARFFANFRFHLAFNFSLFRLNLTITFGLFFSFNFYFRRHFFFGLLLLRGFLIFFYLLFLRFFFNFLLDFGDFADFFLANFGFVNFTLTRFFSLFRHRFLQLFSEDSGDKGNIKQYQGGHVFCGQLCEGDVCVHQGRHFYFASDRYVSHQGFCQGHVFCNEQCGGFFCDLLLTLFFQTSNLLSEFQLFFQGVFEVLYFNLFDFYLFLFSLFNDRANFPADNRFEGNLARIFLRRFSVFLGHLSPRRNFVVIIKSQGGDRVFIRYDYVTVHSMSRLVVVGSLVRVRRAVGHRRTRQANFFGARVGLLRRGVNGIVNNGNGGRLIAVRYSNQRRWRRPMEHIEFDHGSAYQINYQRHAVVPRARARIPARSPGAALGRRAPARGAFRRFAHRFHRVDHQVFLGRYFRNIFRAFDVPDLRVNRHLRRRRLER